jgi:hypothetical protein
VSGSILTEQEIASTECNVFGATMINSLSSRLASMTLRRPAEQYHVVVTQRGVQSWEWAIYRDGASLPIPLRGGYYKAKNTTEAAGQVALREFRSSCPRTKECLTSDPSWSKNRPAAEAILRFAIYLRRAHDR